MLLRHLDLKPGITVLDIGSGSGFPLLELAQRLGPSSRCYGIDPWINASNRAREKINNYGVKHVEVIDGTAENLPFAAESIDLVVSNLGINNFTNPSQVLKQCYRVLKPDGTIAITTNLDGHWREFYRLFEETLLHSGRPELVQKLKEHEAHRGTINTVTTMFAENNFRVTRHFEDTFEMKFLDGTAFLNHYFIKLGWLASWKEMIPASQQTSFFEQLEQRLTRYAQQNKGLILTVPMAYIEGQKKR